MATRPIFVPGEDSGPLYFSENVSFTWHSGMSASQKQKSMRSLHDSARNRGFENILEVSTKSDLEIGRRLSAFILNVEVLGHKSKIECVFQGAKVFERGGPFPQLFMFQPLDAKRYFRSANLGKIVGFRIDETNFSNYPMHAFYDWLYIRSLFSHEEYLKKSIMKFDGFSDIEFNPARSINTQSRTMAILVSLIRRNELGVAADDFEVYRKILTDAHRPVRAH